jgi:hypothetical protein
MQIGKHIILGIEGYKSWIYLGCENLLLERLGCATMAKTKTETKRFH